MLVNTIYTYVCHLPVHLCKKLEAGIINVEITGL